MDEKTPRNRFGLPRKARPKKGAESGAQTFFPKQDVELKGPKLSSEQRTTLGHSIKDAIDVAVASRSGPGGLDENLDAFEAIYEMETGQKDDPWPDSSNVFFPIAPTQMDELCAYLAGDIFSQRFYLVNGNTDEAAAKAHMVERYYNVELWRHDWIEAHNTCIQLALRDGTSAMEISWLKKEATRTYNVIVQDEDEQGNAIIEDLFDENIGGPRLKTKTIPTTQVVTLHDDVVLTPRELRDVIFIPTDAYTKDACVGIAVRIYLKEKDMREYVNGETMWEDAVEYVLNYVGEGQGERASDPKGTATADIGGQISVTDEITPNLPGPGMRAMKGPFTVFRVLTEQYDLDGDDVPEMNVLWVHEQSGTLLGFERYKYWHEQYNFELLSFFPRPNRLYGISIIERLAALNLEYNANKNQINDATDLRILPPLLENSNAKIKDQDGAFGPNVTWSVEKSDDVSVLALPAIPAEVFAIGLEIKRFAEEISGMSDPSVTASTRQTKAQVDKGAQARGLRLGFMSNRGRQFAKKIFVQIHELKKQYQDAKTVTTHVGGKPEKLTVTKDDLSLDFELDIVGIGGPTDKANRLNEYMFLYNMMLKDPDIQRDPVRRYRFRRMLLEAFDLADIIALIGTEEDAKQADEQAKQEMAQQQQAAAAMQAAGQKPPQPGANGAASPAPGAPPAGAPAMAGMPH